MKCKYGVFLVRCFYLFNDLGEVYIQDEDIKAYINWQPCAQSAVIFFF